MCASAGHPYQTGGPAPADEAFYGALQHPEALGRITAPDITDASAAAIDSMHAGCSTDHAPREFVVPAMVFESMRLLGRAQHDEQSRVLSQLIALATLLTNKDKVAAIRSSDTLSSTRVGTLGVRRVIAVAGTWVLQAWLALLGPAARVPGSLAQITVGDTYFAWAPSFMALCYQLTKRDMIHRCVSHR